MSIAADPRSEGEPTEDDREGAVHIHKPKAPKGLGEFLSEIAIIVLGILIALAAEQTIDGLEWAHRVHDAEDAMRTELAQNNRDAYYRLATRPCALAKLDEIQATLIASRDRGANVAPIAPYRRPLRPWQSDAWESASALQITSHMPNTRLLLYSRAYFYPAVMRQIQSTREREAVIDLNTLAINAGRLEPAERDRLFLALTRTRAVLRDFDQAGWLLLARTAAVGLVPTKAEKEAELSKARQDFGTCTAAPDLDNFK
jgi:hypothetical protein